MPKYKIINKPILIRSQPAPDAPVVNVLNPGKILDVLTLKDGWYKLLNGFYVLKSDNLKLVIETEEFPDLNIDESTKVFSQYAKRLYDQASSSGSHGMDNQSTPGTGQGSSQSATNAAGTPTRTGSIDLAGDANTRLSVDTINSVFAGGNTQWAGNMGPYAYETDASGKIIIDSNNRPKTIDMPVTLLGKNNGSTVLSIDDRGYVKVRDVNGTIYVVDGRQGQVNVDPTTDDYYSVPVTEEMIGNREADAVVSAIENILQGNYEFIFGSLKNLNKITIKDIQGIFGYPYQFLPIADPRLLDGRPYNRPDEEFKPIYTFDMLRPEKLGRHFAKKIAGRASIMTMQAGIPMFLKGYSEQARATILERLSGSLLDEVSGVSLDDILSSNGQYYSFKETPNEYFEAVNAVCRAIAIFLGIGNLPANLVIPHNSAIGDWTLDELDWQDCVQHSYFGYFKGAVTFYINAEPQVHEQFTNATRQSQLANAVNQISDQAMEIQFILGGLGAAGAGTFDWPKDGITGVGEGLADPNNIAMTRSGTGLVNSMLKNIRTFLSGGKMIFPEIWADSSFGRSYNVTIKLISPDCDKLSIYLNVLVPLAHILAFAMPRGVGDNSYISPFLIRCWFQSQFNIELGIVSSCEVVKGDAGCWTQDGLPTQITVQLSIKDLYSVMSYALNTMTSNLLTNPAQLNYVANLCGVNIGPTDITRTITLWKMIAFNKAKDNVTNAIRNPLRSLLDLPVQIMSGGAIAADGIIDWFSN